MDRTRRRRHRLGYRRRRRAGGTGGRRRSVNDRGSPRWSGGSARHRTARRPGSPPAEPPHHEGRARVGGHEPPYPLCAVHLRLRRSFGGVRRPVRCADSPCYSRLRELHARGRAPQSGQSDRPDRRIRGRRALLFSGDSGLGAEGRPLVVAALALVSVVAIGYAGPMPNGTRVGTTRWR